MGSQTERIALLRPDWSSWLLADVGEYAAVNIQNMTVHKIAGIAGKKYGRSHKVIGSTPTSCGSLGNDELIKGMAATVGLTLTERCSLVGGDVAGADAVALNVRSAVLRADGGIHNVLFRRTKENFALGR